MFDIILRGGRIVDGSGSPWFAGDVGIEGERISAIGNLADANAERVLNVDGKIVCPGFIDTHVHGDLVLMADPRHEPAIYQGVTTYIVGQDGCGFAPASAETIAYMREYTAGFTGLYPELDYGWSSVDEYLNRLHRRTSLNVAMLIPNGTVRMQVMGVDHRPAGADEIKAMQRLVREGMEQGAVGLSTGLDYIPSLYADTAEITALCEAVAPYAGVYVTHYRSEGGTRIHEAIDEVFAIGRGSGCNLHISHFNIKADEHLCRIDEGRDSGLDVTFDTYPYRAGMTILAMLALPGWVQEGGPKATLERLAEASVRRKVGQWLETPRFRPEDIQLAGIAADKYRHLEGRRLHEAADDVHMSVAELVCELLYESKLAAGAVAFSSYRTEADVTATMNHPCHMAGSDGIYFGTFPHPRGWGAFARFLGHYVREEHAWRLEDAVAHLSYHAARRFRLRDRGLVRTGMIADLVVFDPGTIRDTATYASPRQLAQGVEHVLVGGKLTLENGRHTGITNGQALRRAL